MFKAKHSNLVFTQYEHQKLSGDLALLWGNAQFELPPCRFESLVAGIALHDRGYGCFDNYSIGETSEEEWIEVSRKSFFEAYDDTVADLIVKHHVLRLAATLHDQTPPMVAFVREMRESIQHTLRNHHLDSKLFRFIDRITDACDSISFDFCFQNYGVQNLNVHASFNSEDSVTLQYAIEEGNCIKIAPWPLKVEQHTGYIIAHERQGFPDRIEPKIVQYTVSAF